MSLSTKYLKKEVAGTKSRRLKKRYIRKNQLTKANSSGFVSYNLIPHFYKKQGIFLNNKIIAQICTEEFGTLFSINIWMFLFFRNSY
uniref:ribosomal protein L20 n=1 Tax=Ahnfeltia fastigiata TaxID=31363 RepID=UPI001D0FF9AD|nr:ribosomal protein L20 [Ahnfeltia fastigiata]UAT97946.1 ribosomal protein L20 [Ahnfeltia fastigiata]